MAKNLDLQIKKEIEERFEWLYNEQLRKLVEYGIAQQEVNGDIFCIGVDGKRYLAPRWSELSSICQKPYILQKYCQGFTEILPVPMAVGVAQKFDVYKDLLKKCELQDDIADTNESIGSWSEVDVRDDLMYFPTSYEDNHGGVTKAQWLTRPENSSGWSVVLIEPKASIQWRFPPVTNERQALPNLATPNDLIEIVKTHQDYKNEQAIDLDTYLSFSMLLYPGVILDDSSSLYGSSTLLLGNYLPKQKKVLAGSWARNSFLTSSYSFLISSWDINQASGNSTTRMVVRIA